MARQEKPEGYESQFVGIQSPFAGWVSDPAGVLNVSNGTHQAAIEGEQAPLGEPQKNQITENLGTTLFRPERFGHIAPGQVWTAITDAGGLLTDLPLNGAVSVASSAGFGYLFVVLKNGRLVRIANAGTSTANSFDPDYTSGSHTGHTQVSSLNTDMLLFKDNASGGAQEWVIWSWEDSADADCDIIKSGGTGQVKSWFSTLNGGTALLKSVPHKVIKSSDGNILISNGNFVEQVLIANGALLSAATKGLQLNLGSDYIVTDLVPYNNYTKITAVKAAANSANVSRGEVWTYLWDGTSSTVNGVTTVSPQLKFPLADSFCNSVFNADGRLLAFSNGIDETSKIFEFTGKNWKQVFETGLLPISSTPNHGSLEWFQSSVMIGAIRNEGGNPYAHLFRFYGGGFNDEGRITDGTNPATQVGLIKNFYTNQLFAGVKFGSTYSIYYYTNSDAKYQTGVSLRTVLFNQGILGRRVYPLGFKGTVNRLHFWFSQWGIGASIYLSLFKDYTACDPGNTNDLLNLLIDTDTTTADGFINTTNYFGHTGYHHKVLDAGSNEIDLTEYAVQDLSSFYMVITFTHASTSNVAAIIRKGSIEWSPSQ